MIPHGIQVEIKAPTSRSFIPLTTWTERSPTSWSHTSQHCGEWDLRQEGSTFVLHPLRMGTINSGVVAISIPHGGDILYYPHKAGQVFPVATPPVLPESCYSPGYAFIPAACSSKGSEALMLCGVKGVRCRVLCDSKFLRLEYTDNGKPIDFLVHRGTSSSPNQAVFDLLFANRHSFKPVRSYDEHLLSFEDVVVNFQTQDHDNPERAFHDLAYNYREWFRYSLLWGQMSNRHPQPPGVGPTKETGCCLPIPSIHERNNWLETEGDIKFGLYTRPDGLPAGVDLNDWIQRNSNVGAELHYIDHVTPHLSQGHPLDFNIHTHPSGVIVEWPQPSIESGTLVSGCVYPMRGQPAPAPWMARAICPNATLDVWLLGAENDDYRGCGPSAGFLTVRNAHLLGAKHTVREFTWSGVLDQALGESVARRRNACFWSRQPMFQHTKGLACPPGVRATRWLGKSGETIVCADVVGRDDQTLQVDNKPLLVSGGLSINVL